MKERLKRNALGGLREAEMFTPLTKSQRRTRRIGSAGWRRIDRRGVAWRALTRQMFRRGRRSVARRAPARKMSRRGRRSVARRALTRQMLQRGRRGGARRALARERSRYGRRSVSMWGTHEANVAVRAQNRRREGIRETDVSGRSQRRRQEGAQESDDAARSQKRLQAGTHEADFAGRSQKRRQEGTNAPGVAARSQMRRRQVRGDNNPLENPNPPEDGPVVDLEERIRVLCYKTGVSYKKPTTWEPALIRSRRHEGIQLLPPRKGRAETWRDEWPIEDRRRLLGPPSKTHRKAKISQPPAQTGNTFSQGKRRISDLGQCFRWPHPNPR